MSKPGEVVHGRLVEVQTRFFREAVKPGGVNRSGAVVVAERSMGEMREQVDRQLSEDVLHLAGLLRAWPGDAGQGCVLAGALRDVAGLAEMHLLTEVAMHAYDCLDAVLVEGANMSRAEAVCFSDALVFAQQGLCRGSDLTPYRDLLGDLERLTTMVIVRGRGVMTPT